MFRVLMLLAVVGTLILAASPGLAGNGTLRLSWDSCDPVVVNKDWAGAALYTQVLSITGADVVNNGNRSQVLIGPNVEDAWRFDSEGCQTGQLTVSFAGASKACAVFQGGNSLPLTQYSYDAMSGTAKLDVANAYDDFTPVAGNRYTVYQAKYDHAFSDTGAQDPNLACGFVENAVCFWLMVSDAELLLTDGSKEGFEGADNDWVTWQDPGNTSGCPFVQAEPSTWGRVKGLYR